MHPVRRTAIPAILTAALLVAATACRQTNADKAATGPTATVATEPAPPTTTDPYAVPPVIDAAYVNRVLAGLDAVMGDAVRLVIVTRTLPREALDRLRAVYGNDQWLQTSIDSFQRDLRNGLTSYKTDPGNKVSITNKLLVVTRDCIFAEVSRDYSKVGVNVSSPDTQWVALRPLDPLRDPHGYNSTKWALIYDGYTESRSRPSDPCGT